MPDSPTSKSPLRPAVFLDRDGTINHDRGYVFRFEDFEFISGVPEALLRLHRAGFALVVITNQSGIIRGLYSEQDVKTLHEKVDAFLLESLGFRLDGWRYCSHHPDFAPCTCRKPSPNLLKQAARDLNLDLKNSFMVGDKTLDVLAGINAGVKASILVKTGYGQADQFQVPAGTIVAEDLPKAAEFIIKNYG
ncbi:MAG: D-glycero-beta-D-manno-heptose 1,7-bisphosphate 7-phosphatase [Deltaproteobacteria bacterium]|jgi:D-glycero-D-manno-heptose 1,7-bisphosphate phosphatase|nr:D-glycero-beta-D-manno-heptose 1,7-bisphosphate 7-phosphatase [Deltaproteobacteria bacterium]